MASPGNRHCANYCIGTLSFLTDTTRSKAKKSKVYGYSSSQSNLLRRYWNSHAVWDHSVTCHPTELTFQPLPCSRYRYSI